MGLPTTREARARTPDEAVRAAREIGYPVALKIESPGITHKTDAGGVLLGVDGDGAVRGGFRRVLDNARRHAPGAELRGVLVQEMVAGGAGPARADPGDDPGPGVRAGRRGRPSVDRLDA